MLTLSIIKLASLVSASLAVAAAVSIDDSGRSVTSVEFEGHTVNYYTDAFIIGHDSPARMLHKRDNDCGNSDFEPAPPPYASVSDCQVLAAYVYTQTGYAIVQHPGPVSQTKIAWSGTCAFGASTTDTIQTYIGNEDVGDLITDGVNRLQGGGVVCAQGNMLCLNNGPIIVDQSPVFWALYHN